MFFEISCATCLEELKSIERFIWPDYHENADFMLLPIGVGHTDKELDNYRKEHSIPFSLYPDEYGEILPKFTMKTALPLMYVVDKANKIVYISEGYEDAGYIGLKRILARTSNAEPIYTDPLQEDDDWNSLLYKLNN
ncbi:MAG: redoxin domain-containing protein [Tannerellaceae bacterium]|nr:redoxin domain-containing protein [Tannerellaceae bacterium]